MLEFFSKILSSESPVLRELKDWGTTLSSFALMRWTPAILSGIPCRFSGSCHRPAVGACVICQSATCLEHSFVSGDAYVACLHCIKKTAHAHGSAGAPPPQAPPPDLEQVRKKHLKTLGLKEDATADAIRIAFRRLAAKHHPDRIADPVKRATAEAKFKQLSDAYHWLTSQKAAA